MYSLTTARRHGAALLLGIAAITLSACSAEQPADPEVATLSTAPPETSPDAPEVAPVDDGRPRERLDMTEDEKLELLEPYLKCAADLGFDVENRGTVASDEQVETIEKNCGMLFPLPPWEIDANNPGASDFALAVVECLRDKGVPDVVVSTNEGMIGPSFGDQQSIELGFQYTEDCERSVYEKSQK